MYRGPLAALVFVSAMAPGPAVAQSPGAVLPPTAGGSAALVRTYCTTCHNQRLKTGGLALDALDVSDPGRDAAVWEQVVRKVRAGMMPPSGARRPDRAAAEGFAAWLETSLDSAAAAAPNPGRTEAMHRLNRAEYRNAVRDLLGLDLDVAALLPADDASYGFDNIAGVLRFSPLLLEKYLTAAGRVSRMAVGLPPDAPDFQVFRVSDELSQDARLDGLPFGTRGGARIDYYFPADGEYLVRVRLARQTAGQDMDIPRYDVPQQLEVSLDGERLQVFTLAASRQLPVRTRADYGGGLAGLQQAAPPDAPDPARAGQDAPASPPAPDRPAPNEELDGGMGASRHLLDADWQVRFTARAGRRGLVATWLNRTPALLETRVEPFQNPFPTGSNVWTPRRGAYVRSIEISGPFDATGPGDTPSRARIFVCRPSAADEPACARTILAALARRAFRRPVTDQDLEPLLETFRAGRETGSFDEAIAHAVQRLLVSPEFLFRIETEPRDLPPGTPYRVADLDLASRLSFFLWSSLPDDELLAAAERGTLTDPAVLEQQARRMLADARAAALVENFAGQWLYLRNVPALAPDPYTDPDFDEGLRRALRRETELFVESIIREDRSVLSLLTARYTFLNERLAVHYGIPHVQGAHFRRVEIPAGSPRVGLLGQGSVLAVTSEPNRTSPVKRGKWILENILGVPPPDPPPDVPPLEDAGTVRAVTMRERMAVHRRNPACSGCHALMDPLGLALENFDQAGRWREVEAGEDSRLAVFVPIDASGSTPDGRAFSGPEGLRDALLGRSDRFLTTVVEKLLTYALGRGLEYYDAPAVRAILRDAAREEYRFSSLIAGIATSPPFLMRTTSREP